MCRVPSWLGRAARNRHRHASEQASRRWRACRRDDSARTRRKSLISTQDATCARAYAEPVETAAQSSTTTVEWPSENQRPTKAAGRLACARSTPVTPEAFPLILASTPSMRSPCCDGICSRRVRAAESLRATLSMAAIWSQSTPCLNPKPSASKPGPTSAGYAPPSASSITSKTPSVSATPSNAARATAWFCAAPSGANCLSSRASMTDVGEFASFLLAGCGGVLCAAAVHRCGCCGRHASCCD